MKWRTGIWNFESGERERERERERESTKTPCLIEEENKELIGKGLKSKFQIEIFSFSIYNIPSLCSLYFIQKGQQKEKVFKKKNSEGQERNR